ncbi:MAG: hypothetical protein ACOCTH_03845 [Halodesulfurarchaeum sp.]
MSRQTAYSAIEEVEADGLVVEATGQQRNREYKSGRYLRDPRTGTGE